MDTNDPQLGFLENTTETLFELIKRVLLDNKEKVVALISFLTVCAIVLGLIPLYLPKGYFLII
jgi:hypothetical protein